MESAIDKNQHKTSYDIRGLSRLFNDLGSVIINALKDPFINEIMLNCDETLFAEHKNNGMIKIGTLDPIKAAVIIRTLASLLNKELNSDSPILSGELPFDGSRFEGLLPPLVAKPVFSIRKHNALSLPLNALVKSEMLNKEEALFLKEAIANRRTIIVSGRTGCGKTTLVNALLNELSQICPHDRVISIEDTKELKIQIQNKIALFTSQTSDMSVLLKSALRLRPDRLIVGEVRGSEALDLIDAFSTGHSGGFTTLHAGSIEQALKRLTLLISRHEHAPRLIEPTLAEALDLIVQVQRTPSRHISAIAQVTGFSEGVFHVKNIFNNK